MIKQLTISSSGRLDITRSYRLGSALMLLVAGFACSVSVAAGDVAAGAEKATTCVACHGANGISQITTYPILAGQYPSYLEHSLKAYRDGSRQNAIMSGFAAALSDEDIANLAAYFASLPGPLQTAPLN